MTLQTYLKARYTAGTAESYKREIMIYLSNHPNAANASYQNITNYLGRLRQRYGNAATLNRILCSIKAYYDYLVASGARSDHPARSIVLRDQRSRDVQLQDLFSTEELERLLVIKARYTALSYRNKVLMGLLIYQGLKPQEIAQLRVRDIDLDAGTIQITGTPVTNGRILSLQPGQVLLFYAYLHQVRAGLLKGRACDYFMLGLRGRPMMAEDIVKHVQRHYRGVYAPRKVTAVTIRQSVIANLLKAGHRLEVVQQFAGHKYPSSTERYRQDQVAVLQAAVSVYHPMG